MKRRRLPHIYPHEAWLFVTWHLHGSLPKARYPPPDATAAGKALVWMDRYLDTTRLGPMFLLRPEVAGWMQQALLRTAAAGRCDLRAYAIMANHVHVLLRPHQEPSRLLQSLKGTTAHEANRFLARTGQPFWQRESYDHWVRDESRLEHIVAYVENNPVKAGLVTTPSQYRWSSAWADGELKFAAAR